jgi:hypothetical protein
MRMTINDTSYDTMNSYDLRYNITRSKKTRKHRYESNTPIIKNENDRTKQIANIKLKPNNNHEEW